MPPLRYYMLIRHAGHADTFSIRFRCQRRRRCYADITPFRCHFAAAADFRHAADISATSIMLLPLILRCCFDATLLLLMLLLLMFRALLPLCRHACCHADVFCRYGALPPCRCFSPCRYATIHAYQVAFSDSYVIRHCCRFDDTLMFSSPLLRH